MPWTHLAWPLLFGPLSPVSFGLEKRDALPDAAERTAADAKTFGCLPSDGPTDSQQGLLDELMASGREPLATELTGLGGDWRRAT